MKVLLFAGAGTSVELGVPAMARMANEFLAHTAEWDVEPELARKLMPERSDIEDLIDSLDRICGAAQPFQSLGRSEDVIDAASTLQAEVEWFVQHQCERVLPQEAVLHWGPTLQSHSSHELVVATTNYDRAIELAANRRSIDIRDGFEPFTGREIASWCDWNDRAGFSSSDGVTVLKLHGSTDWYETSGTGEPVKLRHPMPLFADGVLRLPRVASELSAALVLPSREKRVTRRPYPRLSQLFLNAAEEADLCVFVGTSLRDPHILQALERAETNSPTFAVNRSGTFGSLSSGVARVSQTASQFLMSTFPAALRSQDPISYLATRAEDSSPKDPVGILAILAAALDGLRASMERCRAIESLEHLGIPLEGRVIEALIRDDDAMVSRFALGLISGSFDSSELYDMAAALAAEQPASAFSEEFQMLGELVGRSGG